METLNDALRVRVDELTGSGKRRQRPLSTMGTHAAIAELIERNERLERALGQLALEVERLAASQGVAPASHR